MNAREIFFDSIHYLVRNETPISYEPFNIDRSNIRNEKQHELSCIKGRKKRKKRRK